MPLSGWYRQRRKPRLDRVRAGHTHLVLECAWCAWQLEAVYEGELVEAQRDLLRRYLGVHLRIQHYGVLERRFRRRRRAANRSPPA